MEPGPEELEQERRDPSAVDWLAAVRGWDWPTIWLVLGIKLLLLSFGVQAAATLAQHHPGWLEIWNRWDATHYLRLAEHGYTAAGDSRLSLVFFPLYPWLVRAGSLIQVMDYDPSVAQLVGGSSGLDSATMFISRTSYNADSNTIDLELGRRNVVLDLIMARLGYNGSNIQ